jgi:DNA-binding IclR family transcriptional regulator
VRDLANYHASYFINDLKRESAQPEELILKSLESLHTFNERAKVIWTEINPQLAARAAVAMLRASRDGLDIDVSSFSAMMGIPRSSAHRMLTEWESLGYCQLNSDGNRTLVIASALMIKKASEFIEAVARVLEGENSTFDGL